MADRSTKKAVKPAAKAVKSRPSEEKLGKYREISVVTVLAFDDKYGRMLNARLTGKEFSSNFGTIAAACLDYWSRYDKAPKEHLPDILEERVTSKRFEALEHLIKAMQVEHAKGLNGQYVVDSLQEFKHANDFKQVMFKELDRFGKDPSTLQDVEQRLGEFLRQRPPIGDQGLDMRSAAAKLYARRNAEDDISYGFGIEAIDKHAKLKAGQIALFLAPTGRGKTQFLTHVAKWNAYLGVNVLYVTLGNGSGGHLGAHFPKRAGHDALRSQGTTAGQHLDRKIRGTTP